MFGVVEFGYVWIKYWFDQYLGGDFWYIVVVCDQCQCGGDIVVGVVVSYGDVFWIDF